MDMNTGIINLQKVDQNKKEGHNGSLTIVTGYNMDGCSSFLKAEYENRLKENATENIRNKSIVYITPEYIIDGKPPEITGKMEYDKSEMKDIADEIDFILSNSKDNDELGARTFRKLQSLMRLRMLSKGSVLIWDGVENFLHPEWQVAMAELLVKCVKNGMHIKVKTFSPYIVQGIRFFSHRHKIDPVCLLVQRNGNSGESVHIVTHDLNQVFVMFAYPLNGIVNIE